MTDLALALLYELYLISTTLNTCILQLIYRWLLHLPSRFGILRSTIEE